MSPERSDLLIVGGGVGGLTLACFAKRMHPGLAVEVIEPRDVPLGRILVSGNGRCNIYNAQLYEERLPEDPIFKPLRQLLEPGLGQRALDYFVDTFKVPLYRQGDLFYPFSNRADTIHQAMLKTAEDLGVRIVKERFSHLDWNGGGIYLEGENKARYAPRIAFCLGGWCLNYTPYNLLDELKSQGVKIVSFTPALGPLPIDENISKLEGYRVRGNLSLLRGEKTIYAEDGEVLFRRREISGICAFNCSIRIDVNRVDEYQLRLDATQHDGQAVDLTRFSLTQAFPRPFAEYIYAAADRLGRNPIELAGDLRFHVTGLPTFKQAQVSKGGISLSELDPKTLELRSQATFTFLGEMLDVPLPCGGFNLGACIIEALKVAESL